MLAITALVAAGERPPPPKPVTPGKTVEPPPRKLNRAKLIANMERAVKDERLSEKSRKEAAVHLRRLGKREARDAARAKKI